ncbi:MAG: response regulator [Candidatus Aminicenantes bacterium]|nr:MAG: response regulator [Candidatus Aminicenantes bacterium]
MCRETEKRKPHVKFFLVYLCILVFWVQGQAPGFGQHYNFKNYSMEEGLAQSQVYTIFQCSQGYLWIGTYGGGVSKFDGKTFTNYSTKDGLSDNVVYAIIEDRDGNLWMATDLGVNKYDGKTFTPYTEKHGLLQDTIMNIFEDRDGSLWLGTYSKGLSHWKEDHFTHFTTADGLVDNGIRFITRDMKGNLWIGTLNGLSKYNGNEFVNCLVTESLRNHRILYIFEDSNGHLWFATDKGAYYFNGKTLISYTSREGLLDDNVNCIFEDHNGYFWIATEKGVNQLDINKGRFTHFTTREGLSYNFVESIMEDSEGNIWFGTDSGISQFKGKTFTYFSRMDGLPSDYVWCIWEDDNGVIWLGTEKGLTKYDEKNSRIVTATGRWTTGITYPFYKDSQGNLWFGTGEAIIKYDGKAYTNINEKEGLDPLNVFCIYEDTRGNLWFGTEANGVKKYDGKQFTGIKIEDVSADNSVNTIIQDHRGNLWFGTSEGITIYNDQTKKIKNITTDDWLTNRIVMSLVKDEENNLWIGTYGGGVIKYTFSPKQATRNDTGTAPGTIETFTTDDGLTDDEILLMIFDDGGNLWIGTNKGIGVLDIPGFNKTGKKIYKYYGKEDGFIYIECTQNAVYKDSRGNLWFGTIKGAIKYNPREDKPNLEEPATHITRVRLFPGRSDMPIQWDLSGRGVNSGLPEGPEFSYHQNHLTFEYIGISLTAPTKVRYQVKLEGFDKDWLPVSKTNFTMYSNLPPGDYLFKVKACNNSGLWNKDPVTYGFRIKTPYWMTWWFYVLAAIVLIGSILGLIKIRVSHLQRRQRILEEQVRLRTIELEKEKAKVEQANLQLEQRVEERTRKLEIANKQLLHSQKMEAIGTLAGGVAHDLNNVLAGIVSYPELLLMEIPRDSPFSSLRKHISTIQRSGEKAAAIVQDLLTLAGRSIKITEIVNLNQVICEFIESPELEKIISYHPKVKVETHLDENLHHISGSPVHLSKMLMNLSSNAAEAMPDGGKLVISTRNQSLDKPLNKPDEIAKSDYVVLNVVDNGIGISKADIDRIFEPFYTKKKLGRSGTGLGMSVVWGTVQDHNGYIDVQSEEGKGTTITLYFPAARQTSVPVEKDSPISIHQLKGNGESILVVDDVAEQREAARLILEHLGYTVNTVSSGEEAIEYTKNNPVDLLVLDMIMDPGINGLETYKHILKIHPLQKAIIVSGFSETQEVKEAQQLGAGSYVKKPYDLEKLGLAVKNELKKN